VQHCVHTSRPNVSWETVWSDCAPPRHKPPLGNHDTPTQPETALAVLTPFIWQVSSRPFRDAYEYAGAVISLRLRRGITQRRGSAAFGNLAATRLSPSTNYLEPGITQVSASWLDAHTWRLRLIALSSRCNSRVPSPHGFPQESVVPHKGCHTGVGVTVQSREPLFRVCSSIVFAQESTTFAYRHTPPEAASRHRWCTRDCSRGSTTP